MRFFEVFFQYLDKYVRQFQVVQTTPEELVVRVVPTERMNESVSEHIQEEILNYAERSMTVKMVRVEEIAMEATGKRRLMVPLRRP